MSTSMSTAMDSDLVGQSFKTKEEAFGVLEKWAERMGFGVKIRSSNRGRRKITVACCQDKFKKYVEPPVRDGVVPVQKKTRNKFTLKIDCKYTCKIALNRDTQEYYLEDCFFLHNHGRTDPSVFSQYRKITSPIKRIISDVLDNNGTSGLALKRAREVNPNIKPQDVYNVVTQNNKHGKGLTTWQSLQVSLEAATERGLRHFVNIIGNDVTGVFITADSAISICRAYPFCMQMDRTFNVTMKDLVTILNITVEDCCAHQQIVAVVLMSAGHTKTSDFKWVMSCLKEHLLGGTPQPHVIGIDHELPLLNAIVEEMDSYVYLCRKHMLADVDNYIHGKMNDSGDADVVCGLFRAVMKAGSRELMQQRKSELAAATTETPSIVEYLRLNWYPYERHWADSHRDENIHYNWSTTNGVEGMQKVLKENMKCDISSMRTVRAVILCAIAVVHLETLLYTLKCICYASS